MTLGEMKTSACTWVLNLASKQMQGTDQSKISISGNDDVISTCDQMTLNGHHNILLQKGCIYPICAAARPDVDEI